MSKKFSSISIVNYIVMLVIMFIYIFPLLYLFNTSFKSPSEYFLNPTAMATSFDVGNYIKAWKVGNFSRYLINSVIYTGTATIVAVLMALLPAFPIARKYVKGAGAWYSFFMVGMFLPNGLIPFFQLMLKLDFYNKPISFILNNLAFSFSFIMFVGYIKSISQELDHAASIDGCGYIRYLFTIIVPLIKPVIATSVILISIGVWNNIISASIFIQNKKQFPVVLGLFKFYGQYSNNTPVLAAAVVFVAAPLIILYVFLQKYIIEGATAGSVKA